MKMPKKLNYFKMMKKLESQNENQTIHEIPEKRQKTRYLQVRGNQRPKTAHKA